MKIMDVSDANGELLENVSATIMQRIEGLNNELEHGGLVVDMSNCNSAYLPNVSYAAADELLGHNLTEEDRNLAAALVAVQLVQQQKQQQLHQDSNVIVSTSSLASLVSSSHLDDTKVQLSDQQLVITPVDKISDAYINSLENHSLPIIKKYGTINMDGTFQEVKEEFISDNKSEIRDSDCENNKNDAHQKSKKSLPHKKRISRKLKKATCTVSKIKTHTCTVCNQTFNTVDELSSHGPCHTLNIVVQTNQFSCQICAAICDDQLTFFEHLKTHYEPSASKLQQQQPQTQIDANLDQKDALLNSLLPPLNCIHCGKNFKRQKAFEAHMRDFHNNKIEDEFSEPEDLMEGIRSVVEANNDDSGEELTATSVVTDSKIWCRTEIQNNELQVFENNAASMIVEPQQQQHMCQLCGLVFNSSDEAMEHLQNECKVRIRTKVEQVEDADVTNHMDKPTATTVTKPNHLKKKRRKSGQLFCMHCDRVFSHRNSLMYHMRSHTGERPHQCEVCGKSFFAANALKVHMRLHSGDKPYKCEYCGRHFRQWGDLKYHCISIHSDEKQYQCEYCGKDFARKYSLIVHRRIHTGEKNYRCEFCNKTFRASSYLQNHRRIHTGEKPHPCEVCGKPFRVRSDMKRHLNTHSRRPSPNSVTPRTATIIQIKEDNECESIEEEPVVQQEAEDDEDEEERERRQENNEAEVDGEELQSEESIHYARDPLETVVRDSTNTLFSNGHQLFICYPNELPSRATIDTHWIQQSDT